MAIVTKHPSINSPGEYFEFYSLLAKALYDAAANFIEGYDYVILNGRDIRDLEAGL